MKKSFHNRITATATCIVLTAVAATCGIAGEKETKHIVVPSEIREFAAEYLNGEKIVKGKNDDGKYKIECASGTKAKFDNKGEWVEIKNGGRGIPASAIKLLPEAAILYLRNNYNGIAVKKIEKKAEGYTAELATEPEETKITFAEEGNVKKISRNN